MFYPQNALYRHLLCVSVNNPPAPRDSPAAMKPEWWPVFGSADLQQVTPTIRASRIKSECPPSDIVCSEDDTYLSFEEQETTQQANQKKSATLLKKFHDEFLKSGKLNNSDVKPLTLPEVQKVLKELLKRSKSVRDVFNGLHQANVSKQTSEVV